MWLLIGLILSLIVSVGTGTYLYRRDKWASTKQLVADVDT